MEDPLDRAAYKLLDADNIMERISAGRSRLLELQKRADQAAKTINPCLRARLTGPDSGARNTTVFTPGFHAAHPLELPEGWRFVKTRNAVEPCRGAAGASARQVLAALQPDFEQPAHVIREAGLPETFTVGSETSRPEWFTYNGAVYAFIDASVPRTELPDSWVPASDEELNIAPSHGS